jgi:hypothetical protein
MADRKKRSQGTMRGPRAKSRKVSPTERQPAASGPGRRTFIIQAAAGTLSGVAAKLIGDLIDHAIKGNVGGVTHSLQLEESVRLVNQQVVRPSILAHFPQVAPRISTPTCDVMTGLAV